MPRKGYPDTYRFCLVCNRWCNSADPQQMEIGSDGQARCWRHAHLAPKVKGRLAFPGRKR